MQAQGRWPPPKLDKDGVGVRHILFFFLSIFPRRVEGYNSSMGHFGQGVSKTEIVSHQLASDQVDGLRELGIDKVRLKVMWYKVNRVYKHWQSCSICSRLCVNVLNTLQLLSSQIMSK